jgi:hypothetical protein
VWAEPTAGHASSRPNSPRENVSTTSKMPIQGMARGRTLVGKGAGRSGTALNANLNPTRQSFMADHFHEPAEHVLRLRIGRQAACRLRPQTRHRLGELVTEPRRFAQPEWKSRRRTPRFLHTDDAALHVLNAIRRVAELQNIAGQAFDGIILVDGSYHLSLRLEEHLIVGGFRNGTQILRCCSPHRGPARPPASSGDCFMTTRVAERCCCDTRPICN